MHLQSLVNESTSLQKIFAFRKHPFVQIVSGLANPNVILTVQIKTMESPLKNEYKKTHKLIQTELKQSLGKKQSFA